MKALIEGYRSFPGDHCGSVAMRGLLHHYCGLDLPEAAVFGLGAGLACVLIESEQADPSRVVFGRTASMETDLGRMLDVDYREQTEPDDTRAFEVVREEVLAGRPTMLSGDILYLDYREFKVHFPGHRFVLLGFDDATRKVWIADRIREEPELCSYEALAKSRNPPEGMSTLNLWGRFHGTEVGRPLAEAARRAICTCADAMLADDGDGGMPIPDGRVTAGVRGIRRLAEILPQWADRPDAAWLASYNARCIEKFGNGGGNFRRLYAGFLGWASETTPQHVPADAAASALAAADRWTAAAEALAGFTDASPDPSCFGVAAEHVTAAADLEASLFERLRDAAG